jgi:DNA-binding NarL/FixJ family response regulator
MTIRTCLFDDSDGIRESLGHLLAHTDGIELTSVNAHAREVEQVIATEHPQVVLMDIDMPDVDGIEATRRVRAADPNVLVVMLTVFEEEERVYEALCAGAMGYLLKSTAPAELINAIRDVSTGGAPMTPSIARKVLQRLSRGPAPKPAAAATGLLPREREVLQCLVDGLSYKMVADRLGISINTVRSHIKHIYEKLHVRSNTEAVVKTLNERLLD